MVGNASATPSGGSTSVPSSEALPFANGVGPMPDLPCSTLQTSALAKLSKATTCATAPASDKSVNNYNDCKMSDKMK